MTNQENIGTTSINLAGKKGLVIGIANNQSIAYGCAKAMHTLGAELAITYLNEHAEPYVRPLAEQFGSLLIRPCSAASSIDHFDELLEQVAQYSPQHHLVSIVDVGSVAAGLVSDWSLHMTGNGVFVDGGCHVLG